MIADFLTLTSTLLYAAVGLAVLVGFLIVALGAVRAISGTR
jgi:hypothetical protein